MYFQVNLINFLISYNLTSTSFLWNDLFKGPALLAAHSSGIMLGIQNIKKWRTQALFSSSL